MPLRDLTGKGEVLEFSRRIAMFGLPVDAGESPLVQVPHEAWPCLVAKLTSERLTGLAMACAADGRRWLSDPEREEIRGRHRLAIAHVLALETRLLALAGTFDDAGIEVIVLKGSALARTFYPHSWWRPYGDIDLLVHTQDWRQACHLLAGEGFRRHLPEPRPRFDERFRYAALHTTADGLSVDLHRTLVIGPFGLWMDPEELFERTTSFRLGGRSLRRLDDTALLLHACMHASLGWSPPLLMPVRDVAQVAWFGQPDWDELADMTCRWRLRAVVRHAFQTASETLLVRLPDQVEPFLSQERNRREVRTLAAYATDRRRRGGIALSTVRALPDLWSKVAYVRALLFPSREFLTARAGDARAPSYIRRWMIPFRWLARR